MGDREINKALESVRKSMEFEGFNIYDKLMRQGHDILKSKATGRELTERYIRSIKKNSMSDNNYTYQPQDDYCYPGTNVLINKLDLRDSAAEPTW